MNTIKIILLGDLKVGKTAIISQYLNHNFSDEYNMTVLYEKHQKQIELKNKQINLEIWELSGNLNNRFVTDILKNNLTIIFFIYDSTKEKTFLDLNYWYECINKEIEINYYFIVLSNKNDLNNKEVS